VEPPGASPPRPDVQPDPSPARVGSEWGNIPAAAWLWLGFAAVACFAGLLIVVTISGSRDEALPPVETFAAAGIVVALVAAVAVAMACRAARASSRVAIAMAAGFVAIAIAKFGIGTRAFYIGNQRETIEIVGGQRDVAIAIAVGVCVLYAVALWLLAAVIEHLVTGDARAVRVPVGAAIGVLVLGGAGAGFAMFIAGGAPVLYLGFAFESAGGILIMLSVVFAITVISAAFTSSARRVKAGGDVSLYSSLFWVALAFIVLFHVLWIVFMLALIAIWPLRTVTPK
jgi:hypothetical protein